MIARGIRNHNLLNIRRSPRTRWKGQLAKQTDREFVQFESDLMGYRAAFRILHTYINLYQLHTVHDIIYRWCPPEDGNLTSQYVSMVCNWTGMTERQYINFTDEDRLVALVAAMARVECGVTLPDVQTIREAYHLAIQKS